RTGVDPAALAKWGEAPAHLAGSGQRAAIWGFRLLGLMTIAAGCISMASQFAPAALAENLALAVRDFFLLGLIANGIFFYRIRAAVGAVAAAVDEAAHELGLVSEVLMLFEA